MKRTLYILLALLCLTSCLIEINIEYPRWKYSLKCNGKDQSFICSRDTYPVDWEYSVPEFFIKDDGTVIFRFFYKDIGLKLQFANDGPFNNGKKYSLSAGDEYFDTAFQWLYDGKAYECKSGWIKFQRSIFSSVDYTMDFEFDLSAPDGSNLQIRNGVMTFYDRVQPRNTAQGIR